MGLSFTTSKGSIEERWINYALLRDNVQHYLEAGSPSPAFAQLHAIARALGGVRVEISAVELRAELLRAQPVLAGRPIAELAIGVRTRALVEVQWPLPEEHPTTLIGDTGDVLRLLGRLPASVDDVFGYLLRGLIGLTDGVAPGEAMRVIDM